MNWKITDWPVEKYAAVEQEVFTAEMERRGYKTLTTFYADLSIAEFYGPDSVRETYERIKKEWAGNCRYFTEFVVALNIKIWEFYEKNDTLATLYNELWSEANLFACDTYRDEDLQYYYRITD